ncbi:unnamed protein product, partial [Closterium sp. NIES-54]
SCYDATSYLRPHAPVFPVHGVRCEAAGELHGASPHVALPRTPHHRHHARRLLALAGPRRRPHLPPRPPATPPPHHSAPL